MSERTTIQTRMERDALRRLDLLGTKLSLNRTAVLHLAIARLAELEGIRVPADEVPNGVAESR
jgi:predicted transcriptional regulator